MQITLARSADYDGLYVNGVIWKQRAVIDIDDVLMAAGREKFTLTEKYLNEEWVRNTGFNLPIFETDLVELES